MPLLSASGLDQVFQGLVTAVSERFPATPTISVPSVSAGTPPVASEVYTGSDDYLRAYDLISYSRSPLADSSLPASGQKIANSFLQALQQVSDDIRNLAACTGVACTGSCSSGCTGCSGGCGTSCGHGCSGCTGCSGGCGGSGGSSGCGGCGADSCSTQSIGTQCSGCSRGCGQSSSSCSGCGGHCSGCGSNCGGSGCGTCSGECASSCRRACGADCGSGCGTSCRTNCSDVCKNGCGEGCTTTARIGVLNAQ